MRHTIRFAAVSAFALTLAACGPAEKAPAAEDDAAMAAAGADAATDAGADAAPVDATETPVAGETPADGATATPSATPTAAASAAAAAPAAPAAAPAVAMAPPAAFTQCRGCHSVSPGQNGIGPTLAGIHGNRAGAVAGFTYTDGMRTSGLVWNDANLDRYLTDPQGVVPGTMMAIGPLDATQRRAIIAYLKTL
jgi:cytochrome c2